MATDVTEDTVRAVAMPLGIVDVKVCAIDATWSGLKLMRRRKGPRWKLRNDQVLSENGVKFVSMS